MNKETGLSISVVTYKNDFAMLKMLFDSFSRSLLIAKIFIIDNSPDDKIKEICNKEFTYIHNKENIGFGRGHNLAIRKVISTSKYHIVINPDIFFESGALENVYSFMENNLNVGILMPKVLYPDKSIQYLCRLLPTPLDLLLRRIPLYYFSERQNFRYELRFLNYNEVLDIPFLSGCFMFIRADALKKAGFFDERFFMFFEDLDLSRRIIRHYRAVYYPGSAVIHAREKNSSKNIKLLWYRILSCVKYFNKWGWFFDRDRARINKDTIKKLSTK